MTDVRVSDGLVVIATHAKGIFSTNITSVNDIVTVREQMPEIKLQTNIYPNPASEEVNVKFELSASSEMEILLLDEMGRTIRVISKVKRMKGEYTETVSLSGLATGMYYISLRAGEIRQTKPLVISR